MIKQLPWNMLGECNMNNCFEKQLFKFESEDRNKSYVPAWRQAEGFPSYLEECQSFYSIQAFNWLHKVHLH